MATVVIMPKQGQSVESCILTEMKKKKGDTVAVGDILFSYETDKASFEEEAQVAGPVLDVFFADGDEIPVLPTVMVIGYDRRHFARIAARPRTGGKRGGQRRRAARFRPSRPRHRTRRTGRHRRHAQTHPVGESHREGDRCGRTRSGQRIGRHGQRRRYGGPQEQRLRD